MPHVRTCKLCYRPVHTHGLCTLHEQDNRPPARTDNAAWRSTKGQKVRAMYLSDHPYCQDCMTIYSRPVPATEVHHLVEQIDRPDLVFDVDNLIALCHGCHNARHGKGIGALKS